jgi:autotransporter-associated beta strand protein
MLRAFSLLALLSVLIHLTAAERDMKPMTVTDERGGTVTVTFTGSGQLIIGDAGTDSGQLTVDGGAISVFSIHMARNMVNNTDATSARIVQNSGTVNVVNEIQMAGLGEAGTGASTFARYELHGGTLTVGAFGAFLQVGRRGTGEFVQDGAWTVATFNRTHATDPALIIGGTGTGTGTFTQSAGTLNVPNGHLSVAGSGTSTMTVLGAAQASFPKGALLGMSGTGNGRFVQNGGVVSVGDGTSSPGAFGLLISANTGGGPTQGAYVLNAGELRVNQITTLGGTASFAVAGTVRPYTTTRLDLVLIEDNLQDTALLSNSASAGTRTWVYGAGLSASEILAQARSIAGESGGVISSLSILSHGGPGWFSLGSDRIDVESLPLAAEAWQGLGAVLADDARLDLYACDLDWSGWGQPLLDGLADLTGADVHASDDTTGVSGDWVLESSTLAGAAPVASVVFDSERLAAWEYDLAAPTITDAEDEVFYAGETAVTITGANYGIAQGTGKVELASGSDYATATKVQQAVTSWADGAIDFTASLGTLSAGQLYLFVTNAAGERTGGYAVRMEAENGLVVWWKLDETAGTTASDASGYNNAGTLSNMSAPGCWTVGKINNGLTFATDDYVSNTDIGSLSGTLSVAFWMKRNGKPSTVNERLVSLPQASDSGLDIAIDRISGYAVIDNEGGGLTTSLIASVDVCDNAWHHIAISRTGASAPVFKIYVDGVLRGTDSNAANTLLTFTKLFAGAGGGPTVYSYFNGQIDDVRVYNRALSDAEIQGVYTSITDAEDEVFYAGETAVTISGRNFLAAQGAGKVELASSSDYATATKVQQAVTSWADGSIDFTFTRGALPLGSLYLFVTNNAGMRTGGYAVTLQAPTWDGGGADANWATAANWLGDVAPLAGDNLVFAGTTQLTNTNNYAAGTAFGSITFDNTAGAFVIGGNSLALGDTLTNNDADLQTLNLDLSLAATRTVDAASGNIALGGVLSGAGGLTKTGAGTLTLSAANTYTGTTTLLNGELVLDAADAIRSGNALSVGGASGATANTLLDVNYAQNLGSLGYLFSNTPAAGGGSYMHTTTIKSGVTLTTAGFSSGIVKNSGDTGTGSGTLIITGDVAGTGALVVNAGGSDINVNTSVFDIPGGRRNFTQDMSGLGSFTATTTGRFYLGHGYLDSTTLKLADTNTITADTLALAGWGSTSALYLGRVNTLNADTITLGSGVPIAQNNAGTSRLEFNTGLTNPSATIRNEAGTGRANLTVGRGGSHNQSNTAFADFTAGSVDALLNALIIGQGRPSATGGDAGIGTLSFAAGTIDATTVRVGYTAVGTRAGNTGTGTLNLNGAGILVADTLLVGDQQGTGDATGTVNLGGGTLRATTIAKGAGTPTAAFYWDGGTLAHKAGTDLSVNANLPLTLRTTAAHTIDADTGRGVTLASALGESGAVAPLTKTGAGTLTLSAANTYGGVTSVNGGTLALGSGGTGGSLSTSSAISVASGATFAVNQSDTVTQGTDFSGAAITGAGGFIQAGAGTTVFNGSGMLGYSGSTAITGGTLEYRYHSTGPGTQPAPIGNGNVTINGGTLRYYNTNSWAAAVNFMGNFTDNITIGVSGGTIGFEASTGNNVQGSPTLAGTTTLNGNLTFVANQVGTKVGNSIVINNLVLNDSVTIFNNASNTSSGQTPHVRLPNSINAPTHTLTLAGTQAEGFYVVPASQTSLNLADLVVGANSRLFIDSTTSDGFNPLLGIKNNGGTLTMQNGSALFYRPSGAWNHFGGIILNVGAVDWQGNNAFAFVEGAGGNRDSFHTVTGGNLIVSSDSDLTSLWVQQRRGFLNLGANALIVGNGGTLNYRTDIPDLYGTVKGNITFEAGALIVGTMVSPSTQQGGIVRASTSGGTLTLGSSGTDGVIHIRGNQDGWSNVFKLGYANHVTEIGTQTMRYANTDAAGIFNVGWANGSTDNNITGSGLVAFKETSGGTEFAPLVGTGWLAIVGPSSGTVATFSEAAALTTAGTVGFYNAGGSNTRGARGAVVVASGGSLDLEAAGKVRASTITLNSGGGLVYGAAADVDASLAVAGGTLAMAGYSDTVSGVQLTGDGTITGSGGTLTSTSNFDLQSGTVGAILGGGVDLVKSAAGTVTLSAANTYTGATSVTGGTLLVTGSTAAGSAVTVASGGTLGGTGMIAGAITLQSGATFSPGTAGTPIGTLDTGAVTMDAGSTYSIDMSGLTADRITSTGAVTCAGTLTIASLSGGSFGNAYTIVSGTSIGGTFTGLANGSTFVQQGRTFQINYTATEVTLRDVGLGAIGLCWGPDTTGAADGSTDAVPWSLGSLSPGTTRTSGQGADEATIFAVRNVSTVAVQLTATAGSSGWNIAALPGADRCWLGIGDGSGGPFTSLDSATSPSGVVLSASLPASGTQDFDLRLITPLATTTAGTTTTLTVTLTASPP